MFVNEGLIFGPVIERTTADGNKVVIDGRAPAGARISFNAGWRGNGWSCSFPDACRFTATLEQTWKGLKCVVQPEFGQPVLTMDGSKNIGDVNLSDGELVFRAGQPQRETDGEWTSKAGGKMPISVFLSAPPSSGQADAAREFVREIQPPILVEFPPHTNEPVRRGHGTLGPLQAARLQRDGYRAPAV